MKFDIPSTEWLDMVCTCRSDITFSHGHDIVTGKIVDDNEGETVTYFRQDIMRKEDVVDRLKFEKSITKFALALKLHCNV